MHSANVCFRNSHRPIRPIHDKKAARDLVSVFANGSSKNTAEPSLMKVKKEMERHFMWIFHLLATKVKKYMLSKSEKSGSVFSLP